MKKLMMMIQIIWKLTYNHKIQMGQPKAPTPVAKSYLNSTRMQMKMTIEISIYDL